MLLTISISRSGVARLLGRKPERSGAALDFSWSDGRKRVRGEGLGRLLDPDLGRDRRYRLAEALDGFFGRPDVDDPEALAALAGPELIVEVAACGAMA